jgi:hypothetical protein
MTERISAMSSNAFSIRKTEVVGLANERGIVRLLLADRQDQDQASEWLSAQVVSDTRPANQLAAVQLKALQRLQTLLEAEIAALSKLQN